MRRWVEYNFSDDRVVNIDKKRLLKRAIAFWEACQKDKNGYGVGEIQRLYKPYVDAAILQSINSPQNELPYTYSMREMLLPKDVEDALTYFRIALQSRPAVYGILDTDTLFHHRDQFIKEENGKTYILEYFEDE